MYSLIVKSIKRARPVQPVMFALLLIALGPAHMISLPPEIQAPSQAGGADDRAPLYIYQDADSAGNHFKPSGYMGDCGDIQINEAYENNPHSGKMCIRVAYSAKGKGPNKCDYSPPCGWAGVYWQEPPNNWGTDERMKGRGLNLSRYDRLVFWARSDKKCAVEFKVGGLAQRYGDSLANPRGMTANLTDEWRRFEIDLSGADLKHIIGGFCWAVNKDSNPDGAVFYLDDIRFEKR